jgi:hypothetical protein
MKTFKQSFWLNHVISVIVDNSDIFVYREDVFLSSFIKLFLYWSKAIITFKLSRT